MKKEKLNKINVGIDDSTLYAESVTSKSSNSFMCVRPQKRNTQKGITLVALVITIIVMLLLSVVSINLIQNLGLIEKVKLAKEEHRASTIQEQKELFEKEIEISKYEGSTPKTINDLLDKLEEEKLIIEEEKNTIMQTGRITIGTKEIIFDKIILPEGYTRCEYLESNGEQIIFSNELPSDDLTVDVTFALSKKITTYSTNIFVTAYYADGERYRPIKIMNGLFVCQRMGDASSIFSIKQDLNKHNFKYNTTEGKVYWDGIEKGNVYKSINPPDNLPLGIFGQVQKNSQNYAGNSRCEMKLYDYKTYYKSSGLLKSRYIPCIDKNNNPCLYEIISEKTFYNQGTGEFIAGPVVE